MKLGIALVIFGLVIIAGALAYALYAERQIEPAMTACTLEGKVCPDGTVVGREGPNCEFTACPSVEVAPAHSWIFESIVDEEDSEATEQTAVKLVYGDREYHLGTYEGSCALLTDMGLEPVAGQHDGAVCWFAGGGVELGLFEENGRFLVKQGIVEEGTAEEEGFRGDFIAIYTLPY